MESITVLDWVVIAIVGLSALLALFRGFIREVLSLATWIISAIVTLNFYNDVTALLHPEHVASKVVATGLGTLGLFIGTLLLLSILSSVIMRFLKAGGDTGVLDSLLGMVFGVARGLFIVALSYLMLSVVVTEEDSPEWLTESKTLPIVQASANVLSQVAPGYVNDLSELSKQAAEQGQQLNELNQTREQLEKEGVAPSYGGNEKLELERLIEMLEKEQGTQGTSQNN